MVFRTHECAPICALINSLNFNQCCGLTISAYNVFRMNHLGVRLAFYSVKMFQHDL